MNQKKHGLQCLTRPLGGDVESSHMIMLTREISGFLRFGWSQSRMHSIRSGVAGWKCGVSCWC